MNRPSVITWLGWSQLIGGLTLFSLDLYALVFYLLDSSFNSFSNLIGCYIFCSLGLSGGTGYGMLVYEQVSFLNSGPLGMLGRPYLSSIILMTLADGLVALVGFLTIKQKIWGWYGNVILRVFSIPLGVVLCIYLPIFGFFMGLPIIIVNIIFFKLLHNEPEKDWFRINGKMPNPGSTPKNYFPNRRIERFVTVGAIALLLLPIVYYLVSMYAKALPL